MKNIYDPYDHVQVDTACADPEEVGTGKSQSYIGILSNTGPDPLENQKNTKPTFNVGPSSARQRNAIQMAFRWQANDGPLLVVLGSSLSLPSSRKNVVRAEFDPLGQNLLDPHMSWSFREHVACTGAFSLAFIFIIKG